MRKQLALHASTVMRQDLIVAKGCSPEPNYARQVRGLRSSGPLNRNRFVVEGRQACILQQQLEVCKVMACVAHVLAASPRPADSGVRITHGQQHRALFRACFGLASLASKQSAGDW
jgi:hypothetical protein